MKMGKQAPLDETVADEENYGFDAIEGIGMC